VTYRDGKDTRHNNQATPKIAQMITYRTSISPNLESVNSDSKRAIQVEGGKVENKQLWFFLGIAPSAVMIGWILVGFSLTGNWAWELPLGFVFSIVGSMAAMLSNYFKF